jgi:protocatechuate 3,4-dioxygenase beta subunit
VTGRGGRGHSRREFLGASIAGSASLVIIPSAVARAQVRSTPACGEDGALTPPQIEGPYFKPGSPMRATLLEPGLPGTRLVVEGAVLTASCAPIPRALLDFWQADARGRYDNAGYRLRGHQFTDDAGRYRLQTVVPGVYGGRTRHLHVKVQAPGQPVLTTQLYFPEEPGNQRDSIFDPALVMRVRDVEGGRLARFVFVLDDQLRGNRGGARAR